VTGDHAQPQMFPEYSPRDRDHSVTVFLTPFAANIGLEHSTGEAGRDLNPSTGSRVFPTPMANRNPPRYMSEAEQHLTGVAFRLPPATAKK
jgi:hypothetical protein